MPTTEGEEQGPAAAPASPSSARRESPRLHTGELHALVDAALPEPAPEHGDSQPAPPDAALQPSERSSEPRVSPRVPLPDPYVGLVIDRRYEVEKLIAAGGMGLVYRCRHRVLGKKLAIKIIRTDVAQMPDGPERFLIEAKAASAIGNEHIVDIIDFGELPDGASYLVMEYLEGVPLSTLMKHEHRFEVARLADIACQIAEGLGAAHAAGIVHRDLKPDNVFVLERKTGDFVKVLDFGVARIAQNAKKLTQAGTIVGTPHYMSPEQAVGGEVDQRGDIYALGVILYELCSGQVPFDGSHYVAVLNQHLQADPPPLASLQPPVLVPPELERIVVKCLAKDPEQRYAEMRELARDLLAFCAHSRAKQLLGALEQVPPAALLPALSAEQHALVRTHALPPGAAEPAAAGRELPWLGAAEPAPPSGPAALPVPTAPLPAPSPTLLLPRPSLIVAPEHKKRASGLAAAVLLVTCSLAAYRLGSRERGADEREPVAPSAESAPPPAPAPAVHVAPIPAPPLAPTPVTPAPAAPAVVTETPSAPPELTEPAEPATAERGGPSEPAAASARGARAGSGPRRGGNRAKAARAERTDKADRAESEKPKPDKAEPPRPANPGFVNPWPSPR